MKPRAAAFSAIDMDQGRALRLSELDGGRAKQSPIRYLGIDVGAEARFAATEHAELASRHFRRPACVLRRSPAVRARHCRHHLVDAEARRLLPWREVPERVD